MNKQEEWRPLELLEEVKCDCRVCQWHIKNFNGGLVVTNREETVTFMLPDNVRLCKMEEESDVREEN